MCAGTSWRSLLRVVLGRCKRLPEDHCATGIEVDPVGLTVKPGDGHRQSLVNTMTDIPATSLVPAPPSGQALARPADPVAATVGDADTGTAPNAEAHPKFTTVVQGAVEKASMSAEQFLARVVGPGNFACITWKSPDRRMVQRFFP